MKNVYCVNLLKSVKLEAGVPHFSRETRNLFVVASSFAQALEAVAGRYPDVEVASVTHMNHSGVPIVIGE